MVFLPEGKNTHLENENIFIQNQKLQKKKSTEPDENIIPTANSNSE